MPVCTLYGIDFAAMIPTEVAEYGGMVFVMLGNDLTEHTFDGARVKKENGAGIYKFLNDATLDGTIATVTFPTPDSGAGGGKRIDIDGQTVRFDRRRVRAYSEWATERVRADGSPAVIAEGELTNRETGVVYRWMAGPLDLKESRHDVWNGKGFIVAPYKTDVHPVLPSVTRADRGYAFGMLAKTATVVGLQVVMPVRTTDEQEGLFVEQTLERSRLILNTGEDVPWREVGRWFAENLPEPIAALNAEVEATDVLGPELEGVHEGLAPGSGLPTDVKHRGPRRWAAGNPLDGHKRRDRRRSVREPSWFVLGRPSRGRGLIARRSCNVARLFKDCDIPDPRLGMCHTSVIRLRCASDCRLVQAGRAHASEARCSNSLGE